MLGHPIGHSLSPAMQNAALAEMGVDGVYVAFDVHPDALGAAVAGLRALGVVGVNCTIPHKEALLSLVDALSDDAACIGAVNTLELREGRCTGHNTDAPGFLAALRAEGFDPSGCKAVVLGAGGASRAVIVALARCGAEVQIVNRTHDRAQALAEQLNGRLGSTSIEAVCREPAALGSALRNADLLVNTTSVGMAPEVDRMPAIPVEALHSKLFVYDLIYNPLETRLLRTARECGARGQHGAGMLAHQGALALQLWTGIAAPVAHMEQVILKTLSAREQELRASLDNG